MINKPVYGLALNSAIHELNLALLKDDVLVSSLSLMMTSSCMENCDEQIISFLKSCQISLQDLNYLSVVLGPGAYTSLRLGITTMKSFSQLLSIPLYSISLLELILLRFSDDVYLTVIPGRKHHVNCQLNRVLDGKVSSLSKLISLSYDQFELFLNRFQAPLKCRCLGSQSFLKRFENFSVSNISFDFSALDLNPFLIQSYGLYLNNEFSNLSVHQPIYAHDVI